MNSAHIQQELPDCHASRLMAQSRVELSIPTGVATLVFSFFSCSAPVTSKLLGLPPKTLLQWCSQTQRGRMGLPRQCGVTDGSPAFPSALGPGCERKQMKNGSNKEGCSQ